MGVFGFNGHTHVYTNEIEQDWNVQLQFGKKTSNPARTTPFNPIGNPFFPLGPYFSSHYSILILSSVFHLIISLIPKLRRTGNSSRGQLSGIGDQSSERPLGLYSPELVRHKIFLEEGSSVLLLKGVMLRREKTTL